MIYCNRFWRHLLLVGLPLFPVLTGAQEVSFAAPVNIAGGSVQGVIWMATGIWILSGRIGTPTNHSPGIIKTFLNSGSAIRGISRG